MRFGGLTYSPRSLMDQALGNIAVAERVIFGFGDRSLDLTEKVAVMGVLNVTPDSFFDGGRTCGLRAAVEHARRLVEEGADIVDVGGESTRPGAGSVPVDEEKARVLPVIRELARDIPVPVSVDTRKAVVASAALAAGAAIVNDVSALSHDPEMARVVAGEGAGVILMHMRGTPETMQLDPAYASVVDEVLEYLSERVDYALSCGIDRARIAIDPGIGFGKTCEHNLEIIRRLDSFNELGIPVVIGPSRKSFIGEVLGLPVEKRLMGTAAAVALAVANGARIIRVHDVGAMCQVVRVAEAIVEG